MAGRLLGEFPRHDRGDDVVGGRGIGVHDDVAVSGVGGDDESPRRVAVGSASLSRVLISSSAGMPAARAYMAPTG